jgi:hypothetical protein
MPNTDHKNPAWRTIAELQKMGLEELREEYKLAFGKATRSRNRKHLYTVISKKLQETSRQSRPEKPQQSTTITKFRPKRKRSTRRDRGSKAHQRQPGSRQPRALGAADPRLPKAGTTITKVYKGKKINVRVLSNGFECSGKQFRSLSGVAREVTGSIWNGYLFFGLTQRANRKR